MGNIYRRILQFSRLLTPQVFVGWKKSAKNTASLFWSKCRLHRAIEQFSYDQNNRITGATYPGYVATFQYDPTGNRTLAQNPAGSYVTTFTTRNQVKLVTDPNSQAVGYLYDGNGQRVKMTDPSSGVFTSTRDAAGRLTVLENPRGEQTSFTHEAGKEAGKGVRNE